MGPSLQSIPGKVPLRAFAKGEDGSATILSLSFLIIFIVLGGLAVDFNKAMSERTQLQISADTAAHAALYTREVNGAGTSTTVAMDTISSMLPAAVFGENAVLHSDVQFGTWDNSQYTFSPDAGSRTAVRVTAQMTHDRDNPSDNLLLNIIGFGNFEIAAESIYSTYFPPCFTEGFVAEEVVDIQSNNSFTDGFCIHSNSYVSLNSNNYFEPGTVVSMPNLDALDIPKSGFEKNEGLDTALRQGKYRMRLLRQLPDIIDSFWSAKAEHLPPYVYSGAAFDVPTQDFFLADGTEIKAEPLTPHHFEPNAVNRLTCSESGKITMAPGIYSEFVFVSDCEVKFAQGVHLEDVIIATTDTGITSLNSPADLHVGRDDGCAPGGGATLMTLGGFNAASSLNVFGGQILAMQDIEFAANADGIEGASFVSNGRIDGTSNMNMGFCRGTGMENAYRAPYFRMVN